jgi:AcrR family transcriptional regulator
MIVLRTRVLEKELIVTCMTSQPRRQPLQMRSRATFDVIVEAAAQVLVKGGSSAFNTNDVAAKAGVSIGSVYQYFPDKECLLAELKRRNTQALAGSVSEIYQNSDGRPMSETIRAAIRALIAQHVAQNDLYRVLEKEVVIFPEVTFPDVLKLQGVQDIRRYLEKHKVELVVKDLDLASFIIARTFRNVMTAALLACTEKLTSGAIEEELTGFAMRYLTARG